MEKEKVRYLLTFEISQKLLKIDQQISQSDKTIESLTTLVYDKIVKILKELKWTQLQSTTWISSENSPEILVLQLSNKLSEESMIRYINCFSSIYIAKIPFRPMDILMSLNLHSSKTLESNKNIEIKEKNDDEPDTLEIK